jgi:hypothetical protein
MHIRQRERHDLGCLKMIARAVHPSDGYPLYTPDDDFHSLLDAAEGIAAWVAVVDGNIMGPVSLQFSMSLTGSPPQLPCMNGRAGDVWAQ